MSFKDLSTIANDKPKPEPAPAKPDKKLEPNAPTSDK